MIQNHSDHSSSKELMNPWREWIHQFHCCIMMWVILDQWSWSRSPKETRSYCQCWFVLQVRNVTGETADVLLEYIQRNIPEGVSMSVEQTELESLSQLFELPPQAQEYLNQNIKWKKSKKNNYRKDKSLHSQKAVNTGLASLWCPRLLVWCIKCTVFDHMSQRRFCANIFWSSGFSITV